MLTDPPYGVDVENKFENLQATGRGTRTLNHIENDALNDKDFMEFLTKIFRNAESVMKEGASFYIWYSEARLKIFYDALLTTSLDMHENLVWIKNHLVLGRQDYQHRYEPCFYGWKAGSAHYFIDARTMQDVFDYNLENLDKEKLIELIKDICNTTTTIYEAKPLNSDLHPTMKPVNLFKKLIRNSTKEGNTVLDLFGGSGTTLIACEQMNRKCYMMECDETYAQTIINRWEEETGKMAYKMEELK